MRTDIQTIIGWTLTYPEKVVFLRDANFFTFSCDDSIQLMKGYVTIYTQDRAFSKTYAFQTNHNTYSINLSTFFEHEFTDYNEEVFYTQIFIDFSADVVRSDGTTQNISVVGLTPLDGADYQIFDGFSLPNRKHGTDTAGYISPFEADVPMLIGADSVINGDKVNKGEIYYVEGGDDCFNSFEGTTIKSGGNWSTPNGPDWTFGIKEIIVDRCGFSGKGSEVADILKNQYNVDMSDGDYTPVSMRLIPDHKRGYYKVDFIGFNNDMRYPEILQQWGNSHQYRRIVAKEPEFQSLFTNNWYRINREPLEPYHLEIGYFDNNEEFVFVENVDLIVEYDDPQPTTSFVGRPMCAIIFKTYRDLESDGEFTEGYHLHYVDKDTTLNWRFFAGYYMFGKHIRREDAGANYYVYNPDWATIFNFYTQKGNGLCGFFRNVDTSSDDFLSIWIERTSAQSTITQSASNLYHQMILSTQNISAGYSDVSFVVYEYPNKVIGIDGVRPVPGGIDFIYSQLNDSYAVMPDWSMGVIEHQYSNVRVTVTLNNGVSLSLDTHTISLYPTNYDEETITFVSDPIVLQDDLAPNNYYDYDGNVLGADDAKCYIQLCFRGYQYDYDTGMVGFFINRNYDFFEWRVGDNCEVLADIQGRCVIESVLFYQISQSQRVSNHYYMPFTCNVPYVLKNNDSVLESQKIEMFKIIQVVSKGFDEEEGVFTRFDQRYYAYQVYETYNNLGRQVNIGGTMVNEEWDGVTPMTMYPSFYPLKFNWAGLTEEELRNDGFDTLPFYTQIRDWNSLSLQGEGYQFNTLGDSSYAIINGCEAVSNNDGSGDLVSIISIFTLYAFNVCDLQGDRPYIWLKYKNMDGLWRYLPMEMIDTTLKNQTQNLQFIKPQTSPINAYPFWNPYSLEEKVTCAIYNVPPEMHIEDMLFSRSLTLISVDGLTEVSVVLEEDSITRKFGENEDFVLHFIKKQ